MYLENGGGSGYRAKVNKNNQLYVNSVSKAEERQATRDGRSYNINTGSIELTSANESAVLFLKNNEDQNLHITSIIAILGQSTGGSATDDVIVEVLRNPTAGTVVSDATAVDVNSNRNFGSSNTLTADVYKGAETKTLTDGNQHILSLIAPGTRVSFNIDEVLTKGSSIGVTLNPPASNTSMDVMVAILCHLEDPND
jgi:hypothetical protein